jgi:hypothetical protein
MKSILLFAAFALFLLTACNSGSELKPLTAEDAEMQTEADSATEATATNPKFSETKIHGLGIFKIGISVENSIGELIKTKRYYYDSLWSSEQQLAFEKKADANERIYKLLIPTTTLDAQNMATVQGTAASWCKNVEIFFVTKYVVDNLPITDLELKYYKDKLVAITCHRDAAITNAITSKFGKPDKHIQNNETAAGAYFSDTYKNGDVEAQTSSLSSNYYIQVHGIDAFIKKYATQDFAIKDSLDKLTKGKQLKNL